MKKLFFIIAFTALIGMTNAQAQNSGLIGAFAIASRNAALSIDRIQRQTQLLLQQNHPELWSTMNPPVSLRVTQPIQPVSLPQVPIIRQQRPFMSALLPNRDRTNLKYYVILKPQLQINLNSSIYHYGNQRIKY